MVKLQEASLRTFWPIFIFYLLLTKHAAPTATPQYYSIFKHIQQVGTSIADHCSKILALQGIEENGYIFIYAWIKFQEFKGHPCIYKSEQRLNKSYKKIRKQNLQLFFNYPILLFYLFGKQVHVSLIIIFNCFLGFVPVLVFFLFCFHITISLLSDNPFSAQIFHKLI